LAAFAAAFMVSLLAANLTFTLVVGSASSLGLVLRGGESEGLAILERSARSIYTSHIPASLAASLSKLPSVQAEPFTASVGYVSGSILITRGIQSAQNYSKQLLSGSLPSSEGPWIILGERAAQRLGAHVGETIPVASSLRKLVILTTVVAICRFGDMKDDEAVVHEKVARQLSGLPQGMVSSIIVRGLSREAIENLLSRTYQLSVKCSSAIPGNLVVLEANGAPIRSVKVVREIEESLELPFGYYTITFQSQFLLSTLGSVLLTSNKSFQSSVQVEENPMLKVPGPKRPVLRKPDGVEVQAVRQGEFWVFTTSPGIYRIEIGSETFTFPLFCSATFDPSASAGPMHTVRVSVLWSDGSEATDYNLVVKTSGGEVVLARLGLGSETKIDLPKGDYVIEAYRLPYSANAVLSVPAVSEVRLVLPSIQWNIEKLPFQYYTLIKAISVDEMSGFTLASIAGISTTLLSGLSLSMIVLFILLIVNIQNYLYISAKGRLALVALLGASRRFLLKKVGFPSLALDLGLAAIAAAVSSSLADLIFLNRLTLFGHSIMANVGALFLFSWAVAASAWLLGNLKLMRMLAQM